MRIVVLLAFWIVPFIAWGETCISTTNAVWTDALMNGPAWTCGTPDGTDDFILDHDITTNDTLTLSTGGSIDPNAGTWTLDASTATGGFTLTLDAADLDTEGKVTYTPGYRSIGTDPATVQTSASAAGWWYVGDLILCPALDPNNVWVEDCEAAQSTPGSKREMMFWYDQDVWDVTDVVGGGDKLKVSIANLAIGDYVLFQRPSDSVDSFFAAEPYQTGQWFEIIDRDDADVNGDAYITINIVQTLDSDQRDTEYPLARREIAEVTAGASYLKGDRGPIDIGVTGANIISADRMRSGHWMYTVGHLPFLGVPQLPLLISTTVDDAGGDTFKIVRRKGLHEGITSGQSIYLAAVGIVPGERFAVVSPIRITSGTSDQTDVTWILGGSNETVEGVLFDRLSHVETSSAGATITLKNVAIRDSGDSATGIHLIGNAANVTWNVDFLNITGGRIANAGEETGMHGFRLGTGAGNHTATLNDISCRYLADDCLWGNSNGSTSAVTVDRFHTSFQEDKNNTSSPLDFLADTGGSLVVTDMVSISSINESGADTGLIAGSNNHDPLTVSGLFSLGDDPIGGVGFITNGGSGVWPTNATSSDVMSIDWVGTYQNVGNMDRFVVRDTDDGAAGSITTGFQNTFSWTRGIFRDMDQGGTNWLSIFGAIPHPITIENVLIMDVGGSGGGSLLRVHPDSSTNVTTLRYLTLANTLPDYANSEYREMVRMEETVIPWAEKLTIDGLLIYGYNSGSSTRRAWELTTQVRDNANWVSPSCILSAPGTSIGIRDVDNPHASMIRHRNPELIAPADRNYFPRRGGLADTTPCGIQETVGVVKRRWMHAVTGTEPEFVGPLDERGLLIFFAGSP